MSNGGTFVTRLLAEMPDRGWRLRRACIVSATNAGALRAKDLGRAPDAEVRWRPPDDEPVDLLVLCGTADERIQRVVRIPSTGSSTRRRPSDDGGDAVPVTFSHLEDVADVLAAQGQPLVAPDVVAERPEPAGPGARPPASSPCG